MTSLHPSIIHINAKNLSESTIKIINKMVEKVNEISHIRKLEIHIETTEEVIENSNTQQHIEELLNQDLKLHKESISEINNLTTENARLREAFTIMQAMILRNISVDPIMTDLLIAMKDAQPKP